MLKPIIDVKDALHDIRMGMDDAELMQKYRLSAKGLQSLFTKLLGLGVISQYELGRGPVPEIKAKDAVRDIRSGMDDFALMDKYRLSAKGLQSLFDQLLAAGLLNQGDLDLRMPLSEKTVDISPSHAEELDDESLPNATGPSKPAEKESEAAGDLTINLKWECPSCGIYQNKPHAVCPVCRAVVQKLPQPPAEVTEPLPDSELTGTTEVISEEELEMLTRVDTTADQSHTDSSAGSPPPEQFLLVTAQSLDPPTALISSVSSMNRTLCLNWVCSNCGLYQDQEFTKCPECGYELSAVEEESGADRATAAGQEQRLKTPEILSDIRSGMDKADLMAKHGLSQEGAQEFFSKLAQMGAEARQSNDGAVTAAGNQVRASESQVNRVAGPPTRPGHLSAELIRAADKGNVAEIKRLLKKGADVNGTDEEGQTALMWAAMWGYVAVMKALIDHGADIHVKTDDGATALTCASSMGQEEARKFLLERGARQ
ncbi:MAG: ankyrin repeat domain-containing protein [Thermodesulfobacteriota bacterium]